LLSETAGNKKARRQSFVCGLLCIRLKLTPGAHASAPVAASIDG
jgi:hypothetical protein